MITRQEPDEWLMAKVARGQRDCLEPLVRRHADALLNFIQRMTGDRHRGEEIFQEVFLTIWQKRSQYESPRPFKPWLYAITINKCRESYRGKVLPTVPMCAVEHEMVPSGSEPSPVEMAVTVEAAELVQEGVGQLPPQQRAVVVLRIWDGLSYAEIANIVETTEGTVRSNMHHGLAALRRYLEPRLA